MSNYITFTINKQVMGISVQYVEKIMNSTLITKIPSDLNYIEGVINYHDEILTVINLKKLLNLDNSEKDADSLQIIILYFNGYKAGIIVDEVREIEDADETVPYLKMKSQYITGTMKLKNDIVSIINPNIVNFSEQRWLTIGNK